MQEDCWKSVPHTVLLFNFGGPEKSSEVEPFLRRLFEDPFIIRARIPDSLRKMLAKRISGKRKDKATEEYAKIGCVVHSNTFPKVPMIVAGYTVFFQSRPNLANI